MEALPTPTMAKDNDDEKSQGSEERMLACMTCMQHLCTIPGDIHNGIAFFAYTSSVLIDTIQEKTHANLQCRAMKTLQCILNLMKDTDMTIQILPGALSALYKVMQGRDIKQRAKVVEGAVHLMAFLIINVMKDPEIQDVSYLQQGQDLVASLRQDSGEMSQSVVNLSSQPVVNPLSTVRVNGVVDPWKEKAITNIGMLLHAVLSTISERSQWTVRLALCQLSCSIVLQCRTTLKDVITVSLQAIVSCLFDGIEKVSYVAKESITCIQTSLSFSDWLQMQEAMRLKMEQLFIRLGKQGSLIHASQSHIGAQLQVLLGYLHVFSSDVEMMLESSFDSILVTWTHLFALEGIDSMAQVADVMLLSRPVLMHYKKRYVYLLDDDVQRMAKDTVKAAGRLSSPAFLVDRIRKSLHETTSENVGELLLVSHLLLQGLDKKACQVPSSLRSLIHELFDLQQWQWTTKTDSKTDSKKKVNAMMLLHTTTKSQSEKKSIQPTSLHCHCVVVIGVLDIISHIALMLGNEFTSFLLSVLYPIVEKLGSNDVRIEQAAISCLLQICTSTQYVTVESLLGQNMDYLVDTLAMRLQYLDAYPWSPDVLNGILKHMGPSSLSLLYDAVQAIVKSIHRATSTSLSSPHMPKLVCLMQTLLNTMETRLEGEMVKEGNNKEVVDGKEKKKSSLQAFLNEIQVMEKEIDMDEESYINETDEDNDDDDVDKHTMDKPNVVFPYEELTLSILNTCTHLIHIQSTPLQCQVLRLFSTGFTIMKWLSINPRKNELEGSRNELLAAIHRFWPVLMRRLSTRDKSVMIHVLRIVTNLCRWSGDFVGDKFEKELWPILKKTIVSLRGNDSLTRNELQLHSDIKHPCESVSIDWTTGGPLRVQLQTELLLCLNIAISQSAVVDRNILDDIAQTCLFLLGIIEIKEVACALFRACIASNAGEIAVLLLSACQMETYNELKIHPPDNLFPKMPPIGKTRHGIHSQLLQQTCLSLAKEVFTCDRDQIVANEQVPRII